MSLPIIGSSSSFSAILVRSLPKLSSTGVFDLLELFDFDDLVGFISSNSEDSGFSLDSLEKSSFPIIDLYSSFTTL